MSSQDASGKGQGASEKPMSAVERYYFAYADRDEPTVWQAVVCRWVVKKVMESGRMHDVAGLGISRGAVMLTVPEMQALMRMEGWYLPEFKITVDDVYCVDADLRKQVEGRCEAVLHPDYSLWMRNEDDIARGLRLSCNPAVSNVRVPLRDGGSWLRIHAFSMTDGGA